MRKARRRHTKNHPQNRNADSDSEVDDDTSALLRPGNRHRLYRCNLVKATVDAEGSGRNSKGSPDDDLGGCDGMRNGKKTNSNGNLQISHQMGDQLMAFPFQTMELTNWMRHAMPVHAM